MASKNALIKILSATIFFLVLTNIGVIFWAAQHTESRQETNQSSNFYKWLNPELKFAEPPVLDKAAYENFRKNLEQTIEQMKAGGRIDNAAVFFRDLDKGPTFSINPNEGFIPASLLKVPLAMTYFRLAEENVIPLDRKLVATNFTLNLTQRFPPPETIKKGEEYGIEDLLYRLLAYSDNGAWEVLCDYLSQISPDRDLLLETFKDLGIIDAALGSINEEALSAKSYASMFRLLYNASYLSKEFSDKMLNDLSKTTFNDGLRKGVPDNIPIAHKFGERFIGNNNELHDCGIVYYPKNPYLLCIMTQGENLAALSETIATISKAVYEEVDSRRFR
jgi:beta-lactamase class A